MKNYKLTIQYDGTNYAGWQIQKKDDTIQQKITDAIEVVTKQKIKLIGAGRTDSGVHALGQVANFQIEKNLNIKKISHSINAIIPNDISIISMEECGESFHSRFDAVKRSYIYLISRIKSPFYYKYSMLIKREINIATLNSFSRTLLGTHDFTSFARRTSIKENKNCTIYNAQWKEWKGFVLFYIEADRFLHGMVRAITGTLLTCEEKKRDLDFIQKVLQHKDRTRAGVAVPSQGLFLYKIKYLQEEK